MSSSTTATRSGPEADDIISSGIDSGARWSYTQERCPGLQYLKVWPTGSKWTKWFKGSARKYVQWPKIVFSNLFSRFWEISKTMERRLVFGNLSRDDILISYSPAAAAVLEGLHAGDPSRLIIKTTITLGVIWSDGQDTSTSSSITVRLCHLSWTRPVQRFTQSNWRTFTLWYF